MSFSETIQRHMDDHRLSFNQALRFYWYLIEGYKANVALRLVEKING